MKRQINRVRHMLRLTTDAETCAVCGRPIKGRVQVIRTEDGRRLVVHPGCTGNFRDQMEVK